MPNRIALTAPWWAEMTTLEQNTTLLKCSPDPGSSYEVWVEDRYAGFVSKENKKWFSVFDEGKQLGPFESRFVAVRSICRYVENQRENS